MLKLKMPRRFSADYEEQTELRDGTPVTLRLMRATDKNLLVRGFEQMTPESRYFRFFSAKAALTQRELEYFTEIDGENHFALGAVRDMPDGTEDGLGVGRFVRLRERPEVAEVAFAVRNSVQGKGLGTMLFDRLIAAALERDVQRFCCEVLVDNERMTETIHHIAPNAVESSDDQVATFEFDLEPYRERFERHSPLYLLMTSAAKGRIAVHRALDWFKRSQ